MLRLAAGACVYGLAAGVIGCSEAEPGREIAGVVSLDGERLPSGQIVFEPQSGGRIGIGQIEVGAYRIAPARGPTPGSYVVRITAQRPTGRKAPAGASSASDAPTEIYEQYVPRKYNERTELKAEIGPETPITLNFELHSK